MTIRILTGKVSAGPGIWQDDDLEEEVVVPDHLAPTHSDGIAQVVGDSMLPNYQDGDLLFIQYREQVDFGQIGVFKYNGENYVKKIRKTPLGEIRLESLNPLYEDLIVSESDELYTVGRIIGSYRENDVQ
jgi:phage repressor protein C with HTH and peptisase S24 domain